MKERFYLIGILILMGAGWGATQPMAKIAVSAGYRHFGLVFWQLAIGATFLTVVQIIRNRKLRTDRRAMSVYVLIALIGTVLPNSASYEAITHLPSGLISILLSLVPMFAFPIALLLGNETFDPKRFAGLFLGLVGVLIIVAPEASLPERAMIVFIPLALIAPLFYGLEGNIVAKWGTDGLGAIALLHGASIVGTMIALPLALFSGQWINPLPPYGLPDLAILGSGLVHATVYTTYVWMVGRAGAVFAVQVSYLVTAFGVGWAILLLGESYSSWVWAAMAIILSGVFLVQPRPRDPLAETDETRQTSRR